MSHFWQCPFFISLLGYSGNGHYCRDIDECESNNGGCSTSPFVQCINIRVSATIRIYIQRYSTSQQFILSSTIAVVLFFRVHQNVQPVRMAIRAMDDFVFAHYQTQLRQQISHQIQTPINCIHDVVQIIFAIHQQYAIKRQQI